MTTTYLPTSLDPSSVNAKMSFDKVANCLLIAFVALANGMPQDQITATKESSEPLPFLQFTNGGLRVNFGGYHAQAGLGGLLGGTGSGGLHASAGTPWGASAGAGLGGQLGRENLGGGLYARAGLGRGRPEAAAGLGGRLDGRSLNPISGGLYAGATPGGPGVGVQLGGGLGGGLGGIDGAAAGSTVDEANAGASGAGEAKATADAATSVTKPSKGRTNIQIIRSRAQKERDEQKEKEKVVALAAAALPTNVSADGKVESPNKEIRAVKVAVVQPPAAEVGLAGSISLFGAAPVVKSVEKNIVVSAPVAPIAPVAPVQDTINTVTTVDENPTVVVSKPVHPRWHFRKRFWTVPRKVVYVAPTVTADSQSSPSDVVGELFANSVGVSGGTVAVGKVYSGSLFDDIFNIPISTLSAVNQLLKNNVG